MHSHAAIRNHQQSELFVSRFHRFLSFVLLFFHYLAVMDLFLRFFFDCFLLYLTLICLLRRARLFGFVLLIAFFRDITKQRLLFDVIVFFSGSFVRCSALFINVVLLKYVEHR